MLSLDLGDTLKIPFPLASTNVDDNFCLALIGIINLRLGFDSDTISSLLFDDTEASLLLIMLLIEIFLILVFLLLGMLFRIRVSTSYINSIHPLFVRSVRLIVLNAIQLCQICPPRG